MSGHVIGAVQLEHFSLRSSNNADVSKVQQTNPATLREEGFSLAVSGEFESWCDLDGVSNDDVLLDVREGLTTAQGAAVVIEQWVEASLPALGSLEQASIYEAQESVSVCYGSAESLGEVGIALELESLGLQVKSGKWLEGS